MGEPPVDRVNIEGAIVDSCAAINGRAGEADVVEVKHGSLATNLDDADGERLVDGQSRTSGPSDGCVGEMARSIAATQLIQDRLVEAG